MKFMMYWMICIGLAAWAGMEKILAMAKHTSMVWFWVLIGLAAFFWLSAYGQRLEDKRASANPF